MKLCKTCASRPENQLRLIKRLARKGAWMCPLGFSRCGEIDGITQTQMREDVFRAAVTELLNDKEFMTLLSSKRNYDAYIMMNYKSFFWYVISNIFSPKYWRGSYSGYKYFCKHEDELKKIDELKKMAENICNRK